MDNWRPDYDKAIERLAVEMDMEYDAYFPERVIDEAIRRLRDENERDRRREVTQPERDALRRLAARRKR